MKKLKVVVICPACSLPLPMYETTQAEGVTSPTRQIILKIKELKVSSSSQT